MNIFKRYKTIEELLPGLTQHYVKTRMGVINPKIRDNFPSPI